MIYFKSFIRRLTIKTSLYLSLVISFLYWLIWGEFIQALISIGPTALFFYCLANLINNFNKHPKNSIHCLLCNFGGCVLFYPERRKKKQMVGDFACTSFDHAQYSDIYYCPKCRNGFIKDVISDGDNTFPIDGIKKYGEIVDKEYLENIEGRYLTSRNVVKKYSQFFKDKNILEVGAYYGAFAHEVLGIAKSYTGIELSKHAAAHLRKEYLNSFIFDGTVDEFRDRCPESIGKFDTIVLFDVIEHVPDPIKTLNILNSLLKDSGTIIFSTINIESSVCMALGPFWPWYMDMHYYYFSDRGYKILLQRSGFLLKKHTHFAYRVHASYLVKKIISIIFGVRRIPSQIESLLKFMISIKTGETVLVLGQKK